MRDDIWLICQYLPETTKLMNAREAYPTSPVESVIEVRYVDVPTEDLLYACAAHLQQAQANASLEKSAERKSRALAAISRMRFFK